LKTTHLITIYTSIRCMSSCPKYISKLQGNV